MLRDYPKDQDLMRIRCHGAFKKNKGGLTSERYFPLLRFHPSPKKDVPYHYPQLFDLNLVTFLINSNSKIEDFLVTYPIFLRLGPKQTCTRPGVFVISHLLF